MNDNSWDYLSQRDGNKAVRLSPELWDRLYFSFIRKVVRPIYCIKNNKITWESKESKYYRTIPLTSQKTIHNLLTTLLLVLKGELMREVRILPRIVCIITTNCSLKCRACSALTPYFDHGEMIEFESIKRDLDRLFNGVDQINTLEFIGGEPFLHPNICELIDYACSNTKVKSVELTSNAIFALSERILTSLRDPKVRVFFTDYGETNRKFIMSKMLLMRKENVAVQIMNRDAWFDFGVPQKDVEYLPADDAFYKCYAPGICNTLYKGRLFPCSAGPYLYEKGFINTVPLEEDKSSLFNHYSFPQSDGCQYCNVNYTPIEPAEQLVL